MSYHCINFILFQIQKTTVNNWNKNQKLILNLSIYWQLILIYNYLIVYYILCSTKKYVTNNILYNRRDPPHSILIQTATRLAKKNQTEYQPSIIQLEVTHKSSLNELISLKNALSESKTHLLQIRAALTECLWGSAKFKQTLTYGLADRDMLVFNCTSLSDEFS